MDMRMLISNNRNSKKRAVEDIKELIRTDKENELRYQIEDTDDLNPHWLVIKSYVSADGSKEINVERIDEEGFSIESSTDVLDCDDAALIAMIECALNA